MKSHSERLRKIHCMIVHNHYPLGESRVEREAKALLERGYDVDVMCLRLEGEPSTEIVDGIQIFRLPIGRKRGQAVIMQMMEYLAFFVLVFFRLIRLQTKRHYRTVQVHNLPDFLVFSAIYSKLRGAKIILDLHDLMPEFFAGAFQKDMHSWPVKLLIWQEKISCRFADHVITVTDLWRQTLIERGVPPNKVSVVMNVADDRIFHRQVDNEKNGDRIQGAFRLIYHGTMAHRYGVDLLVQAIDRVRHQIPGIHLTIHGRGEILDELRNLVDERELHDHITFSSTYVPITELPRIIQKADLGIVPNRRDIFTDGILPTKLLEYVALGIPVLASGTPIIHHYFEEGMVEFFPPEDVEGLCQALVNLYQNPNRRADLVRNADRFNQQNRWEKVASEYADLVDHLSQPSRNS